MNRRENSMVNRRAILKEYARPKDYSDEFYTPDHIVKALGDFDMDPAAGPKNHAKVNLRLPTNGLLQEWKGRVWLNPPYWKIETWLDRFTHHSNGIVMVNARPDASWFQRLVKDSDGVFWIKGRVRFEKPDGKKGDGPVGSVLIAYGTANANALRKCGLPGFFCEVRA